MEWLFPYGLFGYRDINLHAGIMVNLKSLDNKHEYKLYHNSRESHAPGIALSVTPLMFE